MSCRSSHPILIDDADSVEKESDGVLNNDDLKEETVVSGCSRAVATSFHGPHRTYSALDVVPLRRSDAAALTAEQFGDDEMEEDLIVNSATMGSDGIVADVDDIQEGQLFKTQAEFKRALKTYAMKRGFEYAPTKCNDQKITARCRVPDCPWRIKARQVHGPIQWWVKKFDSQHTCSRAIGGLGHRNCDADFIATFVREQVVANEKYTPKMVQTEILRQHGVKISYWKAYRARERILQEVRGDFEGSFASLPSYMRELRSGDSEACMQLQYQDMGRFHRFFWAFGASSRSFRKHCRPLIGLDGTFLTGKYRGALLTASCIDGNNCILPLAWAVVEGENRYSWHWFLEQLRDGVVADRDVSRANSILTIVSDRQKGLLEAVSDVFPDAAHGFCMYHLSTNLPHAPKNTPAWRRFWAAARAYTVSEFNEHMEKMKELNSEQYKYVVKLPRHRWATHCFLGRRYSMLTSNCAETINSVIRHLKGLPITYLVEETRKKTACYFYQRKINGEKMNNAVTPYAEKILERSNEESRFFTINPSTDVLFQVIAPDSTVVVDLTKKTCSCNRWQIDGIPCNHAMGAISFRHRDPYDFVEDWFKTNTYRDTYNDYVPPTRSKDQWPSTPNNVVLPRPPSVRIQPGRRKVARRESIANGLLKKRCGNCQRWGHNKRSCKNPPTQRTYEQRAASSVVEER